MDIVDSGSVVDAEIVDVTELVSGPVTESETDVVALLSGRDTEALEEAEPVAEPEPEVTSMAKGAKGMVAAVLIVWADGPPSSTI